MRRSGAASSGTATRTSVPPPSALRSARREVPGRIEVEDFDTGGEGLGYHDAEPANQGGQHRAEGVDVEATADVDGAFDVGWTTAGEWLRYSVEVARSGLYTLSARVASQGGGRGFRVEIDGEDAAAVWVPDTGGWQAWRTVHTPPIPLRKGRRTLRLVFDSAGGNLNWIALEPAAVSAPFHGTPTTLPGTLEIEDYDVGGPGVAFGDSDPANNGGAYRVEGVDVETCSDEGGGFDVGWAEPGEWLGYTVNVATPGPHTVRVRVASLAPGGAFHLASNGVPVTPSIAVPGTDGWQAWRTLEIPDVRLPAGLQTLQLVLESPGYWGAVGNFNWLSVE